MNSYWVFTNTDYWNYSHDNLMHDLSQGHYFGWRGQTGMSKLIAKLAVL